MNCPTECPENHEKPYDLFRAKYCELCPNKRADDKFKAETEDEIFYRIGKNKFGFESLLSTFYGVMRLEELPPDKMTVKTGALVRIYKSEKFRFEKLKRADAPKPEV